MTHPATKLIMDFCEKRCSILAALGKSVEEEQQRVFSIMETVFNRCVKDEKIDTSTVKNSVLIPDDLYAEMMADVMRMPAKKRKQYKNCLKNKNGELSKVIWDGELKNWSKMSNSFVKIYSSSQQKEKDGPEGMNLISDYAKFDALISALEIMSTHDFRVWWEDNVTHTGHHTGRVNHRISVPTAAGQPCRS